VWIELAVLGGDGLQFLDLHLLQLGVLDFVSGKFGRVSSSFWTSTLAFPTTSFFRLFSRNFRNFLVDWNAPYFWTFSMIGAPKGL